MNANENVVYMGHDLRNSALWIMNGDTELRELKDGAPFGSIVYEYIDFKKGVGPTFNADGSISNSRNGAYWYSVRNNDGNGTQYRFLDYRYIDMNKVLKDGAIDSYLDNYRIESFGDGTFLIYYCPSDLADFRVVCYDAAKDRWCVKSYVVDHGGDTGVTKEEAQKKAQAAVKADLDELKLRLYQYGSDDGMLSVGMTGYTTYRVPAGTSKDDVMNIIEKNGKLNIFNVKRNHAPIPYDNTNNSTAKIGYYWLDSSSYANNYTDFSVNVMYSQDNGDDIKVAELKVDYESKSYTEFEKLGIVPIGAGIGAKVQQINPDGTYSDMTFALTENGKTTDIQITVGMLTYGADDGNGHVAGNIVDTSTATNVDGTAPITGLTLTYDGLVICKDFKLNVGFPDGVKEYAWGQPGSVLADKEGTTTEVDFSNSGVANIELSASAIPMEKGVDLIIVMDLSGSMRNVVDGNDMLFKAKEKESAISDPKWKQTRVYAMEQALESMIKTLADNNADVRVAISDFGDIGNYEFDGAVWDESIRDTFHFTGSLDNVQNNGIEFYNHLNFVINNFDYKYDETNIPGTSFKGEAGPYGIDARKTNKAHPLYTGKITPTVYTGDGTVKYSAFEKVADLYARFDDVVDVINDNAFLDYGTNYDVGLEYAYQLGYAVQQKNIAEGEDRQTVCIFLSDGAAMQYNYFSGSTITNAWKNWLSGDADDLLKNGTLTMSVDNIKNLNAISQGMLKALQAGTLEHWEYNRGKNTKNGNNYYLQYRPDLDSKDSTDFYSVMEEQEHDLDWDYLCQLAEANGIKNLTLKMYQEDPSVTAKLMDLLIVDESEMEGRKTVKIKATATTPADKQKDGYLIDDNGDFIIAYVSDLIDPSRQGEQYYSAYTGTPDTSKSYYDQFITAITAVTGQECTIDIFTRIAYKNRAKYAADSAAGTAMMQELVASLKKPTEGKDHQTYSPYYYFYNADGKHWMAEAMKGDTDKLYPVINKYAKEDNHEAVFNYYGDVRNNFDTETGLELDGQDYISGFRGLNMELYTVMFSVSDANVLTTDVTTHVMQNIASGRNYDYNADDLAELNKAFQRIISSMMIGATQAWYTDTMGNEYDLYTGKDQDGDGQDDLMDNGDEPKIQVLQYEMDQNHQPTDKYHVLETITFNWTTGLRQGIDANGDYYVEEYTLQKPLKAVSDQIKTSENLLVTVTDKNGKKTNQTVIVHNYVDIWGNDGVISGEFVSYNTNTDSTVYIRFGDSRQYPLAPETFFWTIGVLGHSKFVLEYDVVLEGILDGTRELNSSRKYYDTNDSARLTYVNYLGITRYQEPKSPRYPWGADTEVVVDYGLPVYIDVPNYGKGFTLEYVGYLGTGAAPEHGPLADGFAASVQGQFGTLEVVGDRVKYTFEAKNMSMNTTERFVMALLAEEYENGEVVKNYYYVPVTVVPATTIYYEDNFLNYDAFDANGNPTGDISWVPVGKEDGDDDTGDDPMTDESYYVAGSAELCGSHWSENDANNIMTKGKDGLYSKVYENVPAGNYQLKVNMGNWDLGSWGNGTGGDNNYRLNVSTTSTVTIYFEPATGNINAYVVPVDDEEHFQDTDRPGTDNLLEGLKDAENVYGYDSAYTSMTTHSLGEAMKVTLKPGYYATATFSFWGTGFDVVSLTSRDTGTILVTVHEKEAFEKDGTNAPVVKYFMVDTYYGYKYENGSWVVDPTVTDTLYQVPVVKIEDLDYDNYTAVITAQYSNWPDHFEPNSVNGSYDFYLDAIRIYDPANDCAENETIKDAYVADGEGWPEYVELRDVLIDSKTFDGLTTIRKPAAVFIDGKNGTYNVQDYLNYGPNNELYLDGWQMISFTLNIPNNVAKVELGMKTHKGNTTVDVSGNEINNSSTDLYYDLTGFNGKNVNIINTGEEVLSITNVKVTYKTAPVETVGYSLFSVNRSSVESVLNELNASFKDDSFILAGANTVLGGVLDMNFFINPADLNGTDYYAEITLYAEDGVVTATVPYADWEVRTDYLVVTQKGLAARQMADKIEVVIYNGDGTPASDVWTDSIRDYAMRILEDQDGETKTMLVDMLNYGAAVQTFFNYNTADLADSKLTEAQKAYASETVGCTDQSVAGEGYFGSTLTLKDRILLTMYFENVTTDMYAVVSFTDHKGAAHEIRVDGCNFSEYSSTVYGVDVDELVVADGDVVVTVTVYDADGNVVTSAADSVNSYAARQMGKDTLYEMVAKFTASACDYFH